MQVRGLARYHPCLLINMTPSILFCPVTTAHPLPTRGVLVAAQVVFLFLCSPEGTLWPSMSLTELTVFPRLRSSYRSTPHPLQLRPALPTLVSGALPVGNLGQRSPAQDQSLSVRRQEDGGRSPRRALQPQAALGVQLGHHGHQPKRK